MAEIPVISKEQWAMELTPAKYQKGFYICPFCGSGTGPKGTAAFSFRDHQHGHCFACDFDGDRYDAELKFMGVEPKYATKEEKGEAVRRVKARYDFSPSTGSQRPAAPAVDSVPAAAPADFTEYIQLCADRLAGSPGERYLSGRALNQETMRRFRLGYDPAYPIFGGVEGVVMPFNESNTFYEIRTIRDDLPRTHDVPHDVARELFNIKALYQEKPCFVVESALCAMSIEQVGGSAVALGGIGQARKLLEIVKRKKPSALLILSLDNDDRGQNAQTKLAEDLTAAGVGFIVFNVAGSCNDPNELLQRDENMLRGFVYGGLEKADEYAEELKEQSIKEEAERQERTGPGMVDSFFNVVQTREFEPITTGFSDIDRATYGGFTSKTLVLLSGAPGLGKTALAQHITENIAKAGRDILFINLEMSREQLIARSLSRLVWLNEKMDMTPLNVLRGYSWTDEQRQAIIKAAEEYKKEIAPRFIYNPDGITNELNCILAAMQSETNRLKELNRPAPIICIDYLQLIDSGNRDPIEGLKQAIYQLKVFAKENNTVVIAISATNRASNRTGTVDLESGRDTSATEYSGDMMLGLSYTALEDRREYDTGKKDKSGNPIKEEYTLEDLRRMRRTAYDLGQEPPSICNEISLKVLKNRFGEPEKRAKLFFDGRHNLYTLVYTPVDVKTPFEDGWSEPRRL